MEAALLCSNGMKAVFEELVPEFERASGHRVSIRYLSSSAIVERIEEGIRADLVILTSEAIAGLEAQGRLVAGSRVDLACSGVEVAVRAGAPKPGIETPDSFRNALLQARSIAHSKAGASGVYFLSLIQRLGLADALKPKLVAVPGPVGEALARGEAELGVQQRSELLPVSGIDLVGPLPADLQKMTVFAAALPVSARASEAAVGLVKLVRSSGAAALIRKSGLEPAPPP